MASQEHHTALDQLSRATELSIAHPRGSWQLHPVAASWGLLTGHCSQRTSAHARHPCGCLHSSHDSSRAWPVRAQESRHARHRSGPGASASLPPGQGLVRSCCGMSRLQHSIWLQCRCCSIQVQEVGLVTQDVEVGPNALGQAAFRGWPRAGGHDIRASHSAAECNEGATRVAAGGMAAGSPQHSQHRDGAASWWCLLSAPFAQTQA